MFELLFKQKPDEALISPDDLENSKEILITTNAHRKNYNPTESVNISRNSKYTGIIAKLIKSSPQKVSGTFLKKKKKKQNITSIYDSKKTL